MENTKVSHVRNFIDKLTIRARIPLTGVQLDPDTVRSLRGLVPQVRRHSSISETQVTVDLDLAADLFETGITPWMEAYDLRTLMENIEQLHELGWKFSKQPLVAQANE